MTEHDRQGPGDEAQFEQAKQYALEYMQTIDDRAVYPAAEARDKLTRFREALPDHPTDPGEILELLHRVGSPATVAQSGGRYFGFVCGSATPAAIASKWLADAWDQNAAMYVLSPVASVLESVCEGWLVDLLHLPTGTVAGFVTGTSGATLCGLAAARDELLRRQGWDAASQGLMGAPGIRVVMGDQAHSTIFKALSLLGLGRSRVSVVATDDEGAMRPDLLPELDDRTLLILQAGNVNSGAFDPFEPICETANGAGSWVHVDGAFGLWAAASEKHEALTRGVHRADSWSADAHKTLNAPYDNGIVFCRHPEALTRSMHMTGSYIVFSQDRDGMRFTPEMSRRARVVEVWATLKALGRKGVASLVDDLCDLATYFACELERCGFQIRNRVCFNQVLVSCGSPRLTELTMERLQESGECWCGGAVWQGQPVIRISVCSYRTTRRDIDRSVASFRASRAEASSLVEHTQSLG